MTKRSLKPGDALLVGKIYIHYGAGREPHVGISVYCPYCKREHVHGWYQPDEKPPRSDIVTHRIAHCSEDTPLKAGNGYFVGLDPNAKAANDATWKRAVELYSRWITKTSPSLTEAKP